MLTGEFWTQQSSFCPSTVCRAGRDEYSFVVRKYQHQSPRARINGKFHVLSITLVQAQLTTEPLWGRASEVRQLLLYTISSKGLRISSEDDTDVSSCFLAVH